MKVYPLEPELYEKLRRIQGRLHDGTDRERDFGHKLWLILNEVSELGLVELENRK